MRIVVWTSLVLSVVAVPAHGATNVGMTERAFDAFDGAPSAGVPDPGVAVPEEAASTTSAVDANPEGATQSIPATPDEIEVKPDASRSARDVVETAQDEMEPFSPESTPEVECEDETALYIGLVWHRGSFGGLSRDARRVDESAARRGIVVSAEPTADTAVTTLRGVPATDVLVPRPDCRIKSDSEPRVSAHATDEIAPLATVEDGSPADSSLSVKSGQTRDDRALESAINTHSRSRRSEATASTDSSAFEIAPSSAAPWLALLLASALLAIPLLRRFLRGEEVLLSNARAKILELVRAQPGISLSAVARTVDLHVSLAEYHLATLCEFGHLARSKVGGKTAYIPAGFRHEDRPRFALEQNATTKRVRAYLVENPGASVRQVAAALDLSSSGAYWHIRRLRDATNAE